MERLSTAMKPHVQHLLRNRFADVYGEAIDAAVAGADLRHSVVLRTAEDRCGGCILVCPPTLPSREIYGQRAAKTCLPPLEIAFVATDPAFEGRGWGRRMLSEVLLSCQTTQQGCWLHVDLDNVRAHGLYASLGFQDACVIPDPYGSVGTLMVWGPRSPHREHPSGQVGPTLLNARPGETEKTLCRGVFAPPGVTCR
jgi:ribosomal protein S18 acetylase RimI-like enzyme